MALLSIGQTSTYRLIMNDANSCNVLNIDAIDKKADLFNRIDLLGWRFAVVENVFELEYLRELLIEIPKLMYTPDSGEIYDVLTFDVLSNGKMKVLDRLVNHLTSDSFFDMVEYRYKVPITRDRISIYVHKMNPGNRIGIHNDWIEDGPKIRFTFYPMVIDQTSGGQLLLYDRYGRLTEFPFPTNENWLFAFEVSKLSYHSVTPLESSSSSRYSIVYTLF